MKMRKWEMVLLLSDYLRPSEIALILYGSTRHVNRVLSLLWYLRRKKGVFKASDFYGDQLRPSVKSYEHHEVALELATLSRKQRRLCMSKEELVKEGLLYLLRVIYDEIGLAIHDSDRTILFGLDSIGKKLLRYINLSKEHVSMKRRTRSISAEAMAYAYVAFYITLYGRPYFCQYMNRVWRWILDNLPQRGRKKRLEEIKEEIKRLMNIAIEWILIPS